MSERIRGGYDDALYKSTYTYFNWPIGCFFFSAMEENISMTWTRVCGRCFQLSRSKIVHCTSSAVPGGIDLCLRCHSFVHPDCTQRAITSNKHPTARPSCMLCRGLNATLLCPLCPTDYGGLYGAQLCDDCSAWLHAADHKMCHVDHIVMLNG